VMFSHSMLVCSHRRLVRSFMVLTSRCMGGSPRLRTRLGCQKSAPFNKRTNRLLWALSSLATAADQTKTGEGQRSRVIHGTCFSTCPLCHAVPFEKRQADPRSGHSRSYIRCNLECRYVRRSRSSLPGGYYNHDAGLPRHLHGLDKGSV
jgi:hypothetical protein